MKTTILKDAAWPETIDAAAVKRIMQVNGADRAYDEYIEELLGEAKPIGVPKAVVRECAVNAGDKLAIDGVEFQSTLVNEKFKGLGRVYPYVITCGRELHDWAAQYDSDPLYEFIASSIMKAAIPYGFALIDAWLETHENIGRYSTLNPGSLPSWAITGQRQVFSLLAGDENGHDIGHVKDLIGVELNESCLMIPLKSVSGIAFETSEQWHNCARCKKPNCPNRRAEMTDEAEDMISSVGELERAKI